MRSTRAARSTPTACGSARRGPISSCGSCRRPSTFAARQRRRSTVYALRKDGFSGEIALALKNAPAGFTLSGGVPANQDQGVTSRYPFRRRPRKDSINLSLEGRATIEGRQVVRPVVPAEDMMQAFAYRHLVPAQELKVTVSK